MCLAPWERDAHADHEAAGRAARRAGLPVLSYPIWMWHWAIPADARVPWHRARQVPLPPQVDRVLILGEAHLRAALAEYQLHYNTARPHQGIAQRVPDGKHDGGRLAVADLDRGRIYRKPVLGGLINEYSRAA